MRVLILFLFLIMVFSHCFVSEKQDCFIQASRDGSTGQCDAIIFATSVKSKKDESDLNIILLSCLEEYEVNKHCRRKSNILPKIRLN